MEEYSKNWQRLPLSGAFNARELGGYPTSDGRQTAWHHFVRSDCLDQLSNEDIAFLHGYGVRLVLDLRGPSEASEFPDRNLGDDVKYRQVTLADFNAADADDVRRDIENADEFNPGELYVGMLSNKAGFAQAAQALLDVPRDSCALFHCQAGKDRTGILAMLLLSLAGVDRQDCITNYAQTRENLLRTKLYRSQFATAGKLRNIIDSLPETIAYTYDFVAREFGGAEGYFRSCGVEKGDLLELKRRLVD